MSASEASTVDARPEPLNAVPEVQLPRSVRLGLTLVSILTTLVLLTGFYFMWPWQRVASLLWSAFLVFFYLGKVTILAPVLKFERIPFSPWELAALVTYMDICTACLVVANLGALYRVPWVGTRLAGLELYGKYQLSYRPAMRRVAKLSVALFVMFPIAGTGAIGGAILGRLLGVPVVWIIGCIAGGAAVGSFGVAATADIAGQLLKDTADQLWFKLTGTGVVLAIVAYFSWKASQITSGKVQLPIPGEQEAALEGVVPGPSEGEPQVDEPQVDAPTGG